MPLVEVSEFQEVVQLVALVEVQLKVELWPLSIELGLADKLTVGSGSGLSTVTLIVVEVVLRSEVSVAIAVRVCVPLPRVVVSQE